METLFEFIILSLVYLLSVAFTFETFSEIKCNIIERIFLFVFILIIAPLFFISIIGVYLADCINKNLIK